MNFQHGQNKRVWRQQAQGAGAGRVGVFFFIPSWDPVLSSVGMVGCSGRESVTSSCYITRLWGFIFPPF